MPSSSISVCIVIMISPVFIPPPRYGRCFPYETSSTPCDELYTEGETYVFLLSRRAGGNFNLYLAVFQNSQPYIDIFPPECIDKARKIFCHYYLPTCGNSTVFEPPTSVCEDVCEHLRNLCPDQFQQLALHLNLNAELFSPFGLTMIDCMNTGDYISPLQHCCSDLDIEIRESTIHELSYIMMHICFTLPACTKVNDSGDLVPDPGCFRSQTAAIPGASPSTQPPPTESPGSIGVTLAIALPIIVIFIIVSVCLIFVLRVCTKLRKEKRILKISLPRYVVCINHCNYDCC